MGCFNFKHMGSIERAHTTKLRRVALPPVVFHEKARSSRNGFSPAALCFLPILGFALNSGWVGGAQ